MDLPVICPQCHEAVDFEDLSIKGLDPTAFPDWIKTSENKFFTEQTIKIRLELHHSDIGHKITVTREITVGPQPEAGRGKKA